MTYDGLTNNHCQSSQDKRLCEIAISKQTGDGGDGYFSTRNCTMLYVSAPINVSIGWSYLVCQTPTHLNHTPTSFPTCLKLRSTKPKPAAKAEAALVLDAHTLRIPPLPHIESLDGANRIRSVCRSRFASCSKDTWFDPTRTCSFERYPLCSIRKKMSLIYPSEHFACSRS